MFPFIVIEGLDGCGKSTLSRMFAGELNGLYIASPPSPLKVNNLKALIEEKTRYS